MEIRTPPLLLAGSLFFLLAGCSGQGSYRLHLLFPDQTTREAVSQVTVWALAPGGHSCEELQAGQIKPGDLRLLSRLDAQQPFTTPSKLDQVPAGDVLFAAEGETSAGIRLLLGCTEATVKASSTVDVTVNLVCVCQPVPGNCAPIQEIPGNGIDDDCDGLTDECDLDSDCNDHNGCTEDHCLEHGCHNSPFPDGLQCSDGNPCTSGDACQDGTCTGTLKDCSAFDGACTVGACDPKTGVCGATLAPDGTPCDDGRFCTMEDSCLAGACQGKPKDCADSDPCTLDSCNKGTKSCDHTLQPKPGAEGPLGDPTCSDGIDNDCDGLTDGADPNCVGCTADADCDDKNLCTADTCAGRQCVNQPVQDGTACDDGRYCTVSDHCQNGICVSAPRDCSSLSGPCVDGVCLEAQQQCAAQPRTDGTACDDGKYCTVGDACLAGACLGSPRDCADTDPCTVDSCNETAKQCDHVFTAKPGAEGPAGNPTCSNGIDDDCDGLTDLDDPDCGGCQSNADCNDNNPCTDDACNSHACTHTNNANSCDDGNPCSTLDKCSGGTCVAGQTNKDGDGDHYFDAACPGGNDCNDNNPNVNPGAKEGPYGDPTCSDGIDNNCDGRTDGPTKARLSGWNKRVKLTISHTAIGSDLADFPLPVHLSASSGSTAHDVSFVFNELSVDADRLKLAVTTADETTQCFVEIESWDSAGKEAWLWVRAPAISSSSDTILYLYFDSTQADNVGYVGDKGSAAARNVWNASFKGVWHLDEDPSGTAPQMKDSTSNARDGTAYNETSADQVPGEIDGSLDFNGTNRYVQTTSNDLRTADSFTVECWFQTNSTLFAHHLVWEGVGIGNGWGNSTPTGPQQEMNLTLGNFIGGVNLDNQLSFFLGDTDESNGDILGIAVPFTDTTQYHHVAGVIQNLSTNPAAELFLDGQLVGTDTAVTDRVARTGWNTNLRIGRPGENSRYFNGIIDEVRVSITARSADWIAATYLGGKDGLIDFGTEEFPGNYDPGCLPP